MAMENYLDASAASASGGAHGKDRKNMRRSDSLVTNEDEALSRYVLTLIGWNDE